MVRVTRPAGPGWQATSGLAGSVNLSRANTQSQTGQCRDLHGHGGHRHHGGEVVKLGVYDRGRRYLAVQGRLVEDQVEASSSVVQHFLAPQGDRDQHADNARVQTRPATRIATAA